MSCFGDENLSHPLTLQRLRHLRRARGNAQVQSRETPRIEGLHDTQTGMPSGIPEGARCVQRFDDSLNSAIHITYRISLRSSSMREPRDPLLKVLFIFDCITFVTLVCCEPSHPGTVHRGMDFTPLGSLMILPQVHLRKPCYDFYFL